MTRPLHGGIAVCLCWLGCGAPDSPPASVPPSPSPSGAAAAAPVPSLVFTDITREAGIDFVHANGATGRRWMPETMGSGCVLFDYDGDGWLDLFLANSGRWPGATAPGPTARLYGNRGDGTFADVTAQAGLAVAHYGMGAAAGDYDGDGDADLYLTALGDNLLMRNDSGVFVDVTGRAGVAGGRWQDAAGDEHPEWSTSAAWVDYDNDGWLDLFVCNYVRWSPANDLFTTIDGVNKSYATPQQYDGLSSRLFRNRGDGTFADVTARAGVLNEQGKSLGVAVADIDGDGWQDLLVANDTQPTFLYRNRGDGRFEEAALPAGVAYDAGGRARAGMGIDVAAVANDRLWGIAIGNFSREPVSLFRQRGGGLFADEAAAWGIERPTYASLTFGLLFFDADLDGYADLLLANGHIEPRIQAVHPEIPYAQAPQLFWNRRGRGFVAADAGPDLARPRVGRGLAVGDIDGDGDLDAVLTSNGGPPALLRNDGPAGRALRVRLRDQPPNVDALGAVVTVTAGDIEQRAQVRTGSSYLSQSATALTFGLGPERRAQRLAVRWPDGRRQVLEALDHGAEYLVERGRGVTQVTPFR